MTLNKSILDPPLIGQVNSIYNKSRSLNTDLYQYISSPFKVLKFNNLIEDVEFISNIKDEISKIPLNRKINDLYSLWQSDDLRNLPNSPCIQKFIGILENEIEPALSKMLDVKFNGKLSATASFYQSSDMLLCHDDKCEDRCVAFVYYLTGGDAESGGAFEMFDHDEKSGQPTVVVESLPPQENSFLIFEVGDFTYHQVSEVKSDQFQRWSINGWFHSDRNLNLLKYKEPLPKIFPQIKGEGLKPDFLDDFINLSYCTPSMVIEAQQEFEQTSYILLKQFFTPEFYNKCVDEFKAKSLNWKNVGPPNRRKYQNLDIKYLTGSLNVLVNLLRSPAFMTYLRNITSLTLIPLSESEKNPSKLILEAQKWSAGSYTMVTDNDSFFEKPGLDLYLFFNSKDTIKKPDVNGGCTNYLAADNNVDEDEDDELLNIEPVDNALILVYRTEDTIKFTKYINHCIAGVYYSVVATYFETNVV